jgi:hypothetical protein
MQAGPVGHQTLGAFFRGGNAFCCGLRFYSMLAARSVSLGAKIV